MITRQELLEILKEKLNIKRLNLVTGEKTLMKEAEYTLNYHLVDENDNFLGNVKVVLYKEYKGVSIFYEGKKIVNYWNDEGGIYNHFFEQFDTDDLGRYSSDRIDFYNFLKKAK